MHKLTESCFDKNKYLNQLYNNYIKQFNMKHL